MQYFRLFPDCILCTGPARATLGVLCVYDTETDFETNIHLWESDKLPPILFMSLVLNVNTDYYDKFSDEDRDRFNRMADSISVQYCELKKQGKKVSRYLEAFCGVAPAIVVFRQRRDDARPFMVPYTNTCLPGMKISVRPNGTIDMCERINATFPIGEVAKGLNFSAISSIIQSYNHAITRPCTTCVFAKHCSLCFAFCNRNCSFTLPDGWCEKFRQTFIGYLTNCYSIMEMRPSAFDDFFVLTIDGVDSFLFRF